VATSEEHYDRLLADHYTWMLGGDLELAAARERKKFEDLGIRSGALAVDLGCGPGPQTLALADLGFQTVIAVDMSQALLDELEAHSRTRPSTIKTCRADLLDVLPGVLDGSPADVVVCMRDTLLHLPDRAAVADLFGQVAEALAPSASFVLTYRDLTQPLMGIDRMMPVRSDDERIMLCVLDFDAPETVSVNDLVYTRGPEGWELHKSSYPKLRLAPAWIQAQLAAAGLKIAVHEVGPGGMWTTLARSPA